MDLAFVAVHNMLSGSLGKYQTACRRLFILMRAQLGLSVSSYGPLHLSTTVPSASLPMGVLMTARGPFIIAMSHNCSVGGSAIWW